MPRLTTPRYQTAKSSPPGDKLFWETVLHQSDVFAYNTANEGKGGPFGAQLWLVNPATNQYILVGTPQSPEDSNAVVSKGLASAHAEAENLSPEKRQELMNFLESHRGEDWEVVQISSGESCPSCRSKQVILANELIEKGLIKKGAFHVAFKATYDQTNLDAGFNDAPYDQTFRAISELGILDSEHGLFSLEEIINGNPVSSAQCRNGELVYNAVNPVDKDCLSDKVKSILKTAGEQPVAIIVAKDGSVMSFGLDERNEAHDKINLPEKTAIVSALHKAAARLRAGGKFESWNLEDATLVTNIRDIGPKAYAESLWYSLSSIQIATDYSSHIVDTMAQEIPGISNTDLFKQVAADYNTEHSPLRVAFLGNPEQASAAHLLWKAHMTMQGIQRDQTERLNALSQRGLDTITFTNGSTISLHKLVSSSEINSHYDGKQAEPMSGTCPS